MPAHLLGRPTNLRVFACAAALVVDAHRSSVAAELLFVARTLHGTRAHDAILGCPVFLQLVVAVALTTIFETSVREAGASAEIDAFLHSHVIARGRFAGEGAGGNIVSAAAGVLPLLGGGKVDVVLGGSSDLGDGAVDRRFGWLRTRGDSVAARKLLQRPINLLIDYRGELAGLALVAGEHGHRATLGDAAGVVEAGIDGLLEDIDIPSIDKIAMETIAGRVAVGEDKGVLIAIPFTLELVRVIENLIEDRDHVLGELRWAGTRVVLAFRVAHV